MTTWKMLGGHIELYELPSRREGNRIVGRGRTVVRDGEGRVIRDETYDLGVAEEVMT